MKQMLCKMMKPEEEEAKCEKGYPLLTQSTSGSGIREDDDDE
jgi:hypothetical protein